MSLIFQADVLQGALLSTAWRFLSSRSQNVLNKHHEQPRKNGPPFSGLDVGLMTFLRKRKLLQKPWKWTRRRALKTRCVTEWREPCAV